jgi:hypothetical protein
LELHLLSSFVALRSAQKFGTIVFNLRFLLDIFASDQIKVVLEIVLPSSIRDILPENCHFRILPCQFNFALKSYTFAMALTNFLITAGK